ncbi:MAG: (Fe-S)-binding protein [Promethearchaeota archaeon]
MSTTKLDAVKDWVYICARCNSCKFIYRDYEDCCPAGSYFWFEPYWASGKNLIARALLDGELEMSASMAEKIFSCVLCGNCEQQCEQDVGDHLMEIFEALRQEAIQKGFGPMPAHVKFRENIERVDNPYGEPREERFKEDFIEKHIKDKAEVVYFMGCTSAYREKDLVKHTVSILEKMGVDFGIMKDEKCCGSPLITTGQLEPARSLAESNVEQIKEMGAKIVITSCAGCYRTLANQYSSKFGIKTPFKVMHSSEFIEKNIKKLKFKKNITKNVTVTYHDPCHLGRHGGVYEAPRNVIKKVPGISLVEMPRNRENAWCCGAGAGVKSAFKDFALETSVKRIEEAEGTGTTTLVTCCPFCERNLGDAVESKKSPVKVVDLCEIVDDLTE